MIYRRMLVNFFMVILAMGLLAGCQAEKQKGTTLDQLAPANADEAEIYAIVGKLQDRISASEWDLWLELYTDDAVLSFGKEDVTKQQMRDNVQGITYKIKDMVVLNTDISGGQASVSVSFDGNGKKQYETYQLTKKSGQWLIYKETNP